jgi:hypothetical protein
VDGGDGGQILSGQQKLPMVVAVVVVQSGGRVQERDGAIIDSG